MNINYLTVLPQVSQDYTQKYTLVDGSQESMKSVIRDKINFSNADKNQDDFLTYEELANIKLSVNFDVKKDKFQLTRGVDLLNHASVENILSQKGISFYILEEELKKLDKNKDGKIDSNEVEQNLSQSVIEQKKAYRAYKLNNIKEAEYDETRSQSAKKQIAALEKQIQSLENMLNNLKAQKSSKPLSNSTTSQESTNKHATESINKQLNLKELETKYGTEEIEKVVNAIERITINDSNSIADTIISQTNTDMSKEDIVNLAQDIEAVAMNETAAKEAQELNAIEQFSPANTPVSIDKKNVDFTIGSIEQKIGDLNTMKDKVMQEMMDSQLKKLYTTA